MIGTPIRFEIQDRVGVLTLNRPDKLNALVPEMKEGFEEALRKSQEPAVKALLLRGEGRGFCAGGDIAWMLTALKEKRMAEMEGLLHLGIAVAFGLRTLPKPVVAVIQGPAAGAGMSLALAADLRIATPDAKFSMAFVKIALHPDWGGSVLLSQLVNPSVAAELMLTGDALDAGRAKELGLVNQVVASDALEQTVNATMTRFAQGPSDAYGRIKASLLRNSGHTPESFHDLLKKEGRQMQAAMANPDATEGLMAFLEKRAPKFA